MGADGGTIPKRCELVKNKKKKEKVERDMENVSRWRICQITQQPLKQPIVACPLGRLFNKETLIEALLTKTVTENENAAHIKSLKDVKELVLTENPAFEEEGEADMGDVYKDYNISPFICPVVGLEMNGNHRFVVNWNCGCVVSEKACKELKSNICHKCGKKSSSADLVVLNGTTEEMDFYRCRLEERRIAEKNAKKLKKAEKNASALSGSASGPSTSASKSKSGVEKRKLVLDRNGDEGKKTKSIQNDPKASKTFKSLFTTCDKAKNQETGHWVTFNPQYY